MSTYRSAGHDLGLHRVLSPAHALPQAASRLDSSAPAYDNEIVIDVQTLNIDSASFHQIVSEVGRDKEAVSARILSIVNERGKMQNPVTGSGGMLLGTIRAMGPKYQGPMSMKVGDTIATLVSLTLTPLEIDTIKAVHFDADQVDVKATAYLWPSSPIVVLPEDLPSRLALSALDVCGAPAQAERLVRDAGRVLILGAGKSGMLCAAAARDARGADLKIYAIDLRDTTMSAMREAGVIDDFRCGNAQNPVEILARVMEMTQGQGVDVVINTCNVADTEMSAILPCKDRGTVYFFNMATNFSKAALGCEGVGKDVDLLIGNGYAHGHAQLTLEMVRKYPVVRQQMEKLLQ